MASRADRLKKLLTVQEQLKSLHEMKHAAHLAAAAAAAREAAELAELFDQQQQISALFPEVFHRRISNAWKQEESSKALAEQELKLVAAATMRTNLVERNYREAAIAEEREMADRERLDMIANQSARSR